MASLEEVNNDQATTEAPVDSEQVELVSRMAIKMIRDGGGLQTLEKALQQSQDPAEVTGQFIVQLIAALAENLSQQIKLDPRIFLATDGFLDNILNYIEEQLGLPRDFSDQVEGAVLEMIKGLAQGEKNPQVQSVQPGLDAQQQPQMAPPQGGGLDAMPPQGGM